MAATAAVASPARPGLPRVVVTLAVHETGDDRCPKEEKRLHDSERKAGFEHGACLVQIVGQGVVGLVAVGPERS